MMIRDPETLSDRLMVLRYLADLKPNQVASKLKLTTREYLILEDGKNVPDYFVLRRMMALYGCTSDYLLYGIMLGLREELFKKLTRFVPANGEDNVVYAFENGEGHWKSEGALK